MNKRVYMNEEQLEATIAALVKRKKALEIDCPEHRMLNRVLNGLRYTYEEAGPIWEGLDDMGWDATPP
jgi:hypothetical protein